MEPLNEFQNLLIKSVEQLDEEEVIKLVEKALEEGTEPLELLDLVNEGMDRVGKLYESKDYYIADLIMAGLIFKQVLELDKMNAHFHSNISKKNGKVIVGTVQGDIHDIGKDIFRGMLETNGFEVIDLGVDISKEIFVKKVIEHKPDILGLSGVLTNTLEAMKEVVNALVEAGVRDEVKIIIGGDHLSKDVCQYVGADNFATSATDGILICKEWVKQANL